MAKPAEKRVKTGLVPEHITKAIEEILKIEAPSTKVESWEPKGIRIEAPAHNIEAWATSIIIDGSTTPEIPAAVEDMQGVLLSKDIKSAAPVHLPAGDLEEIVEAQFSSENIENAVTAQFPAEEAQFSFEDLANAVQAQLLSELENAVQAHVPSEEFEEPLQNNLVFNSLSQPVEDNSPSRQVEEFMNINISPDNFEDRESNPLSEPLEQDVECRSIKQASQFKDNVVSMENQQDVVDEGEQNGVKIDPDYVPPKCVSEDVSDSESQVSSEELDDHIAFGPDFIKVNGEHYPIDQYFGHQWALKINALDNVEPMVIPPYMLTTPHPWQLKGAAQVHYLSKSEFRGAIVGDQMGLGKTLLAILAMYLAREESGSFSLVVCPKSVQRQWLMEIEGNFEVGHGLRAIILEDSLVTAHSILAGGYKVVVVSYEFLESNLRSIKKYQMQCEREDHNANAPRRPTSSLHTNMWRILKLPIKRLVLDESQRIKNWKGRRHLAGLNLSYFACIMLSGTFLDNKWSDIYGLLPFLRGHPFQTYKSFQKAFVTFDYDGNQTEPEEHRMRLLQKLLLAIVIARPASLLELIGCKKRRVGFILRDQDSIEVSLCVERYILAQKEATVAEKKRRALLNADLGEDGQPLVHAIRAQQYSLHPAKGHTDTNYDPDHDDFHPDDIILRANAEQEEGGDIRANWLQSLQTVDLVSGSARVQQFCWLYDWITVTYPGEKILVFSCYLKFLDILAAALKQEFDLDVLRYDGTVKTQRREAVRQAFKEADANIPMFVTAGTGGVGLNLTDASVIIQTEIWWNHNSELQVYGRCYRQGQAREVKIFRLFGENSAIDILIWKSQTKKTLINERLMAPLVRSWDEPAIIPEIALTVGFLPMDDI